MDVISIPNIRGDYNTRVAHTLQLLSVEGRHDYGQIIKIIEQDRCYVKTSSGYEIVDDYVPIPVGYDIPLDYYDYMGLDMILLDMRDITPEDITPWSINHHGGIIYIISYDPYYTYNKIISNPTKPLEILYSGSSLIHWDYHKEYELPESFRLLDVTVISTDEDNLTVLWRGVEYKLTCGYGIGLSNVSA